MSQSRAFAAGLASGVLLGRGLGPEQALFGRHAGWSIAGADAAGWVTDFLNAAYYRRDPAERKVDDLRLAFAIVTTHWSQKDGRRLRLADVTPFHRCYGRLRVTAGAGSPRGTLSREQLLEGAARMFGDWFPDAYGDNARRGWGIAFRSREEKRDHRPERRLALAVLGELTPPIASAREQGWHTYAPVEVPSAARVIDALTRVEAWPDYASETGRFTALRDSQLDRQTFEIEVTAGTAAGLPVFQRGYVTVTRLVGRDHPEALRAYFEELEDGLARFGDQASALRPRRAHRSSG